MQPCFHCGLNIPRNSSYLARINGDVRRFCCNGCLNVCKTIFEAGLEGFYRRTPEDGFLAPPPEPEKDVSYYDFDEVQGDFVTRAGNRKEAELLIEGIHCAACVRRFSRH